MRTNGEIAHDAQIVALMRRCADALDAIAGTLAAIHAGLKPPVFITPRAAKNPGGGGLWKLSKRRR